MSGLRGQSVRVRRRAVTALYLATFVSLLAGCSPPSDVGVSLDDHGAVKVVSCGRWIEGVVVVDANSRRDVWSAHVIGSASANASRGSVVLGQVPEGWVESTALALTPRPSTWRFSVRAIGDETIVVPDAVLRPGRVFRPGTNRSESVSHFNDQTCSGLPISTNALRFLLVAVLVVSTAYAVRSEVSRRRRQRGAVGHT
jgi:hypothetical protein